MAHLKRTRASVEGMGMRPERQFPRLKRRVNCKVEAEGNRHVGVVLDMSPGGFFVQTNASVKLGSTVVIVLHSATGEPVEVEATVANRRRMPRRLATVTRNGFGCALRRPQEDYYQFLGRISSASTS